MIEIIVENELGIEHHLIDPNALSGAKFYQNDAEGFEIKKTTLYYNDYGKEAHFYGAAAIAAYEQYKRSLLTHLQMRVVDWAEDKKLFLESTPLLQLSKTREELEELQEALEDEGEAFEAAIMEAGDMLVTLTIILTMLGSDLETALGRALKKIEKRTGETRGGIFVKDSP